VTVAAVLVAYALGAGTLGARILARADWTARAPLLAILTYLSAAWSVVAALALAGLTLAVHATALGGAVSQLIGACVLRLRATYATPGGLAAAGAGLLLTAAVAARTALTAASHLRLTRRQARGTADTAAAAPGRTAEQAAATSPAGPGRRICTGAAGHGADPRRARAGPGPGSSPVARNRRLVRRCGAMSHPVGSFSRTTAIYYSS
jgi:hypothetical protein